MASLTHVAIWTQNGWKRISPEAAGRIYPYGKVSANCKTFMCELCGQYVSFAFNGYTYYFMHNLAEEDKNCPERTFGHGYNYSYTAGEHELPIKIKLTEPAGFELELGLIPVPQELVKDQTDKKITISSTQSDDLNYIYSFDRLNSDAITYLPIGTIPCSQYELSAPEEIQSGYWPKQVRGVPSKGAVFDGRSKRILPEDADVTVGKEYYLMVPYEIYREYADVTIRFVTKQGTGWHVWYLYSIVASDMTRQAAQFFLHYSCRLTKEPITIQPIWPVYIQSPYIIRHREDPVWLHIKGRGDITTKPYPAANMTYYPAGQEIIYAINSNIRQQMISVGRANVLEYTYLWKDNLDVKTKNVEIEVLDKNGTPLDSGIRHQLPVDNFVRVKAPYDGSILVKENGFTIEKRPLKPQSETEVDDIRFGKEIIITQGLDIVWSAQFQQERRQENGLREQEFLELLRQSHARKISIPHTLSAIVPKLKEYPKIKKWLFGKMRSGYIEEDALKNLKKIVRTI